MHAESDDANDAHEQLVAASIALAEAIVSNDATRIAACLADEWRMIDEDGETTRDRFLELVRSGELTHSMMRAVGDLDVRVYGDVGIVFARIVNTAHFAGKTYDADEWTTDVFQRRSGRWACVHSHVSPPRLP